MDVSVPFAFRPIEEFSDSRRIIGQKDQTGDEKDPAGHDGEDEADDAENDQAEASGDAEEGLHFYSLCGRDEIRRRIKVKVKH